MHRTTLNLNKKETAFMYALFEKCRKEINDNFTREQILEEIKKDDSFIHQFYTIANKLAKQYR